MAIGSHTCVLSKKVDSALQHSVHGEICAAGVIRVRQQLLKVCQELLCLLASLLLHNLVFLLAVGTVGARLAGALRAGLLLLLIAVTLALAVILQQVELSRLPLSAAKAQHTRTRPLGSQFSAGHIHHRFLHAHLLLHHCDNWTNPRLRAVDLSCR